MEQQEATQRARAESDGLSAFADDFDLLPASAAVPAPPPAAVSANAPATAPIASSSTDVDVGQRTAVHRPADGLSASGNGLMSPPPSRPPIVKRKTGKNVAPHKPSIGSLFARARPDYGRESIAGSVRHRSIRGQVPMRRIAAAICDEDDYMPYGKFDTYVNPAYVALNPEYTQPPNAKPVWGFAKPIPRVVRSGMIPISGRMEPGADSRGLKGAVNIVDLEKGRVKATIRQPNQMSAQVGTARRRRETKLLHGLQKDARRRSMSSMFSGRGYNNRIPSAVSNRNTSHVSTMSPAWEDEEDDGEEGKEGKGEGEDEDFAPHPRLSSRATSTGIPPDQDMFDRQSRASRVSRASRSSYFGLAGRVPLGDFDEEDEEDDLEDEFDDLDPALLAENLPVVDEVFNNHTTWSVIRSRHRESFAEFLAVFVQLTIGFCANIQATVKYNEVSAITTAWGWGFAAIAAIHIAGGVSGSHLNPALTIMLWIFRGFPGRMVHRYIIPQFCAAFLAAFLAYGLYYHPIQAYRNTTDSEVDIIDVFISAPRYAYVEEYSAFLVEFTGTALIVITVLALGDDQNVPPGVGMNPLIIGLVGVGFAFSFTFQTGFAGNPTKDLAPRIVIVILGYGTDLFTNPYWFYGPICGPIFGALFGALVYDTLIFTGGESPVNYPWGRTKRAWTENKQNVQKMLRSKKNKTKNDGDNEKVDTSEIVDYGANDQNQ